MAARSSRHLYDLLTHINLPAAEVETPVKRVQRLAGLFSWPHKELATKVNGRAMAAELENLCAPLVYMVLNVPTSFEQQDERVFVAVSRPGYRHAARAT